MRDFFEGFTRCPERAAFHIGGQTFTYQELDRESAVYARGLAARGITAGDRVALQARSSRALIIALLGHLRSGVIHVPINTRYQSEEITHILEDSEAALLLCDEDMPASSVAKALGLPVCSMARLPQVHTASDRTPLDMTPSMTSIELELPPASHIAMLIYTSGTTGRSKGVALTRKALAANIGATTELWQWTGSDHLVLALPLFHVHGLGLGILGTLLNQMTATILPRFDAAAVVEAVVRGGTIFMGVPTMYARLIAHLAHHPASCEALSSARLFTSGSAALPASAHHTFETLTGHRILERYGMSETGFTLSNPYDGERKAGSVGHAVPGYEVKVVDDEGNRCQEFEPGEIWVKGTGLMQGYWNQPEVTKAAFTEGWFRTGDVAVVDGHGYHHIQGRRSADIIKSGGFKISALEIEDVLLRHPAIAEAAVVGLPCPEWGERIVAAVVLHTTTPYDSEAVLSFAREHLARFKCPRELYPMAELPRNALGKLQKHRLKETLRQIE